MESERNQKSLFQLFHKQKKTQKFTFLDFKTAKNRKGGGPCVGDCLVTDELIHMIKHVPVIVLRNSGGRFLGLKGKFKRARNEEEWVIRNDL